MADLSIKKEPYVIVNTSAADTGDQGLSRFDGLICAAPICNSISTDTEPRLFGSGEYKRFLKYYTGKEVIDSDMDPTIHHVHQLLNSVSVMVLNAVPQSAANQPLGSTLPSSNYEKYGEGMYISYSGYIAITDTGKSFLVDNKKHVINKKFKAILDDDISITSATWLNLHDKIHDNGGQVFTFYYDSNNKLNIEIGYSTQTVTDATSVMRGIGFTKSTEDDLEIPTTTDWNIAAIRTNPIGQVISNDYYAKLGLKVVSNEESGGIRTVKVQVYGENDLFVENNLVFSGSDMTIEGDILAHNFIKSSDCNAVTIGTGNRYNEPGNQITVSELPKVKITDHTSVKQAVTSLNEYDGGYRIDFLFDSGITDSSVQSTLANVAENIKALAVVSIPGESVESIYTHVQSQSYSKGWMYRIGPFKKQNFGGYTVEMSLGIQYIEAVARNKSNLIEFAPVFNFVNGYVPDAILTRDYNKREREFLLGTQVNTVKRDRFRGISFINNNVTADPSNSLFNEEQIVRMANRYAWDIDYIMEQFLGQIDDELTARDIRTKIEMYHYTTMSGKKYSPEQIEVICDESNNSFGNGEMNVIVNIYVGRSLKKITVYNKFLPLSAL